MKIQCFKNGRWHNLHIRIPDIHRARAELMCIFIHTWLTKENQDLDDRAFDIASDIELGQVVSGATGLNYRIVR